MRLAPLFFLLLAACPKAPPPPPPPAPVAAPVDWLAERPVVGAPAAWAPAAEKEPGWRLQDEARRLQQRLDEKRLAEQQAEQRPWPSKGAATVTLRTLS
jgi:hypothetical protein